MRSVRSWDSRPSWRGWRRSSGLVVRLLAAVTLLYPVLVVSVSHTQAPAEPQRQPRGGSAPERAPQVHPRPVVTPAQKLVRRHVRLQIPVEVSLECEVDEDCVLIDQRLGLACCWAGACDTIDYSHISYIAVNRASFEMSREEHCPPDTEGFAPEALTQKERGCGPMPACPAPSVIDDRFAASCVEGFCKKTGPEGAETGRSPLRWRPEGGTTRSSPVRRR